jgi:hypothetical protein
MGKGGSQHNLGAAQAAANVAGSHAGWWAIAHVGTEIHSGYGRPEGGDPLDYPVEQGPYEFAETSGSPDDI